MAEPDFDRFVFVDWSARSKPKTGDDSVWISDGNSSRVRTHNSSTRQRALDLLGELLTSAVSSDERVLVGFDFPYGYPVQSERVRPYVLHCEIWPRVIRGDPATAPSGTLDEAQVIGLVEWASPHNSAGTLAPLFAPPGLTPAQAKASVAEEGWILGV